MKEKLDVKSDLSIDKDACHIHWAGSPVCLHSHHYHFQLQYTLNLTDFIDGSQLTRDSACWTIKDLLRNKFGPEPEDPRAVLDYATNLFSAMGFGRIEIDTGVAEAPFNMYADGWTPAFGYAREKIGRCEFPAGFVSGALEAAYGRPFDVVETACRWSGAPRCTFEIRETDRETSRERVEAAETPAMNKAPDEMALIPHSVDVEAIRDAVLSLPLLGDPATGLVNKFGVLVNWTPQRYYSGIGHGFIMQLADYDLGLERNAEELLFFDGEACALNTFHGITRSEEWKALIKPMLSRPGDAVVAVAAIANCLGWGRFQITDLVPGEGLSARLYEGQEGLAFRSLFGMSEKPRCYAFSGAVRAVMEVFLPGEVVEAKFGRFKVKETRCITMGDPYCEFLAERVS